MGVFDFAATEVTVAVLNGDSAAKIVDFEFDGFQFLLSQLLHMSLEITHPHGGLTVEYNSSLNGRAEYDHDTNTLFLGFIVPDSITKGGLIVHEVTHAMFDLKQSVMDIATSESISYIVQCQFIRANYASTGPTDRVNGSTPTKDKVFEVGWRLAGQALAGTAISATDVSDMRAAVAQHPYYINKHTNAASWNGM